MGQRRAPPHEKSVLVALTPLQVHEKLEQEVMRETVAVNVETKEDEWGLHMLNTIVGLDCLLREGLAVRLRRRLSLAAPV